MAANACPACSGNDTATLEVIPAKALITLYAKSFGIDVSSYFGGLSEVRLKRCGQCDLRFFDPPCPGDGVFYENLQRFDWYYQDEKPEYVFAQHHVPPEADVLEVGCGKGAFYSFLPDTVRYTGLEFNDAAVAKGQAAGLHILKESVEQHAQASDRRYDVVCAFQVLEHVPDAAAFVRSCISLLNPRGTLMLAVPAEDSFLALSPDSALNMPPHHVLRWSDLALSNLAQREGLAITQVWHETVAAYHERLYETALAHEWCVSHHLLARRMVEGGIRSKAVRRLLRLNGIRRLLAARTAARFSHAGRGQTVLLVAQAGGPNQRKAPSVQ